MITAVCMYDCTLGLSGAKAEGEGPFDPVALALANALAGATGIPFHALLLGPDRIYHAIDQTCADGGQHACWVNQAVYPVELLQRPC